MRASIAMGMMLVLITVLAALGTVDASDTGAISGKVIAVGNIPSPEKIEINKDTEKCGVEQELEGLVIGADKGIKWAVVSLDGADGNGATPPVGDVQLNQQGCRFDPHVVVVPPETEFKVLNSDGILHNVHTYSEANPPMNRAQPGFVKEMKVKFGESEIVKVTCDAHSWMNGYIVVTGNPFTVVTDDSGAFKLDGVKPGSYKLRVWHETLGEQVRDVTVSAEGTTEVTFEMAMK